MQPGVMENVRRSVTAVALGCFILSLAPVFSALASSAKTLFWKPVPCKILAITVATNRLCGADPGFVVQTTRFGYQMGGVAYQALSHDSPVTSGRLPSLPTFCCVNWHNPSEAILKHRHLNEVLLGSILCDYTFDEPYLFLLIGSTVAFGVSGLWRLLGNTNEESILEQLHEIP